MSGECSTHGHRCATCGDRADTATVVSIEGGDAMVRLADGSNATVAVDLIDGVGVGDWLLVHQGVAIASVSEGVG